MKTMDDDDMKPTIELGGAAGKAQKAIQSRPYQLHVKEAQAMGETPMTPEEFSAQEKTEKKSFVQGVMDKLKGK